MKTYFQSSITKICFLLSFIAASVHAANHNVAIQNFAFVPASITINVGDTVTWAQADFTPHTTTSGPPNNPDGLWDSPELQRGQTFTHTFSTAGTFAYFCRPHPDMTGSVIVQGAAATPPTVSITSPANNAVFTAPATIEIQASATVRGSTITGVEFFNGGTSLGTDNSAPYSVSTTLNAGTHSLTARATAANGQSGTSPAISVTVNAPTVPAVTITSPANNATLTAPATIEVQANATVEGSTITGVEFFNGGTSLGTDNSAPYSVSTTLNAGTHSLTARATAANGQTGASSAVTVTANAPTATPVVAITAPANNATLNSTNVTITATGSVEGGSIVMIEFFDGTTFLNMVHGAPFTINANLAPGTHVLTAKATANTGATATSAPVSITIQLGGTGTAIENPYPPIAKTDTTIELQTIAAGMIAPLGMAAPGDGRLFVFDQAGPIYVIANGTRLETPLLDIRSRLVPLQADYDERGLLGLAVHPNFAQNGLIYTYSSEPTAGAATFPIDPGAGETNNHQNVLAEWKIDTANTNRVDPASRREILRMDQPQFNHNGGAIHFGPDGMLYLALGDGGAADDQGPGHSPGGNGQDLNKIHGKVIRIDVNTRTSGNGQYGVPSDNPFVGRDGLDEIYAYGFRNPYSWSFDRLTGELYVADVGQNQIEELDRVFKGGNYGWPIKEGTFFFNMNGDGDGFITRTPAVANVPGDLIDPIAEYDHSEGLAIVGGYVYRGTQFPNLLGRYVTGDFGRFDSPEGRLFVLDRHQFRELRLGRDNRALGQWIKGFGQDQQGELYVFTSNDLGPSGSSGKMLKIVPADYDIDFTAIHRDGTNVMVNWRAGVGPYVVESKSSLDDRAWRLVAATATNSATVATELQAGFMRVRDAAGIRDGAFTVHMTALAERPNPVNNTNGLGMGTLVLEGNTLHFDIRYSGLLSPATLAHIHGPATAAEARGVLVDLAPYNGGAFGTSGTLSGSITLSPEHKAHILAGRTYVNIHTTNNPGGEIRGQVAPMVWMADLTGAAERPNPVQTPGHGSAIFMLVGNKLTFDLDYADLKTNATLAHIHGPAGLNAPASVMVDLAPFNGGSFGSKGTMGGTITLTPDQLAALVDGLTYVNIHSSIHGGGEIRGQILPRSTAVPLTASLSGAAEVPSVDTPATGTASFALEGDVLHFNIRYNGLKAVANNAHIHGLAKASEPAGVLIGLVPFHGGPFGTNGTISGSVVLSDAHRAAILEGRTYVNIHSGAHGGGEIRGQILPSVMHTVLLGASERPASVHTSGRGRGSFLLTWDQLSLNLTYSALSAAAVAAHIHGPSPTSEFANVLVNLADLNGGSFGTAGSFAGTVLLTPAQIAAIADALTYVNIHTGTHPGGEVRGQVIR